MDTGTYGLVLEEEESCWVIWKVVDRVLRFLGLDDENETEDEQCPEKDCRPVQRRHEMVVKVEDETATTRCRSQLITCIASEPAEITICAPR